MTPRKQAEQTNAGVGRRLPSNEDAERTVLGLLLIGSPKAGEIYESVTVDDFFDRRHQIVYTTARDMWEKNLPQEMPLVCGQLTSSREMEEAGGAAYVSSLIDGIPTRLQVAPYVNSLKSKRVLREMAKLSSALEEATFEADRSGTDPSELIDDFMERVCSLGKMAESEDRGMTWLDAARSELGELDKQDQLRIYIGVKTVDESTGGFRAGELILLTAETGVGKSFLALQTGKNSCNRGHHVLYCSGEMLAQHLMGRILASDSQVKYFKIRRPERMTKEDRAALMQAASVQCAKCRILDKELTLSRIKMAARSMAANKELGVVVVDYDELVEVRGKDEWDQQRILVRALKSLSMELAVPVILVSQLRKLSDKDDRKHPTLHRLYGSGAKIKHASIILHVDRPFVRELKGDESKATIIIMKSRDGRLGSTDCIFNLLSLRFEEKPPEVNQDAE